MKTFDFAGEEGELGAETLAPVFQRILMPQIGKHFYHLPIIHSRDLVQIQPRNLSFIQKIRHQVEQTDQVVPPACPLEVKLVLAREVYVAAEAFHVALGLVLPCIMVNVLSHETEVHQVQADIFEAILIAAIALQLVRVAQ